MPNTVMHPPQQKKPWKTYTNLPVFAYGHCEFTVGEAETAFALLAYKVSAQGP